MGELPGLLEALDEGEFTPQQQRRIREGVTLGRRDPAFPWDDYLPTDRIDEDGESMRTAVDEIDLLIDDYWPWPDPDWDYDCEYDGQQDEKMLEGDNDTLLVRAARCGRTRSIELLLELGADVTAESGFGETPLFAACLEGHVGAVRILLDFTPPAGSSRQGLPLRAFKSTFMWAHPVTDYTVLAAACTSTDALGLRGEENPSFKRATPALHQAQHAVVKCLLEEYHLRVQEHAIENEHNGLCQHAFYQLIRSYRVNEPPKVATIQLFLNHGADPNQWVWDSWDQTTRNNPRMTILHALCHSVHRINNGYFSVPIYPNLPTESVTGRLPGYPANAYPAVRLLLQYGADPHPVASNGTSPLSYARIQMNRELEALLRSAVSGRSVHRLCPEDGPDQLRPYREPPSHPSSKGKALASSSAESPQREGGNKRKLRSTPMDVRAEKAGVADEMQPLPSDVDEPDYKQRRRKVQIANQQIVARAEAKLSRGKKEPQRSPRGKR